MATIIGVPQCSTKWGNTGQPACDIKIDHLKHLLIHFDGFEVPDAEIDSWNATLEALQEATLNPLATRLFPVKNVYGVEDATEAPAKMTSGYGKTAQVIEKPHQLNIELENIGIEFFKRLRKFNNNKKLRVFWVDSTFIGGQKTSTGWTGFQCDWHLNQVKPGNVADYTKYVLQLEISDPKSLTDNLAAVVFPEGFDLDVELSGITDVTLSATAGTGTIAVSGITSIAKEDFISMYATELAASSSNCFLLNGVPTTPANVTNGVANFSGVDPGATIVKLTTPALLAAKGVGSSTAGGFESNEVTVTVGGA